MSSNVIIETKHLTKSYGKSRGIVDVNLTVMEGEIFGFIGPNGAGKSTTIRTLLSLIKKTSGEATIFGLDCEKHREEILAQVGYLPSEIFYYDNMKAIDLLKYSASFYPMADDVMTQIARMADILQLDLQKKIEDMSLGNKKKVGIIQGLLHNPKLIILDEPTSGLDPLIQKKFFELIQERNKQGATVLFSSHILGEVQKLCDRVAIIKDGKIIQTKKISELKENSYKKVTFSLKDGQSMKEFLLEGATAIEKEDSNVSFIYKGDCNELLRKLTEMKLSDVEILDPPLEDIFMHYFGE